MSHDDSGVSSANLPTDSGESDARLGQILDGRYRLISKLGEGGMGEVYAAEHVHIEKRVAVKVLRPEIVSNEEAVVRFRQEARSASSIGHKNIIAIEDFGSTEDGGVYLCMELLDGEAFSDMLESGTLDAARITNILIQTGHGLAAAHAKGIIHRDMKPENIFVTIGDVPKLLDFGIAKVAQGDGENHLTRTGTIFGTPFYMAPEQALGQGVDARADVYAMGVIMYEAFTGTVPFGGDSFMAILTQHITTEPESAAARAQAEGRTLPMGALEVINKAMAKDVNERYQTMDELVAALVELYREVSGAGMTGYMEAYQDGSSAPPAGSGSAPALDASAPAGNFGPPAQVAQPALAASSGSSASWGGGGESYPLGAAPKKSKAWLFILAALVVAGGAAAVVLFVLPKDGASPSGSDSAPSTTPVAAITLAVADAAAVHVTTKDAGAISNTQADAAAEPLPIAAPKLSQILVDSVPRGATIFLNGKKHPQKTPTLVAVTLGDDTEIRLKRRRYKSVSFSVDGTKSNVSRRLTKVRRSSGGQKPKDPCKIDPSSPACLANDLQ